MPSRLAVLVFFTSVSTLAAGQQDLFQEAVESYQHKQYDEALSLAGQALQADGNNPAYLHLHGVILASLRRLDSAEDDFRRAVALAPDQPVYALDLGALLHNERKYADAVPVLTRAVDLAPENLIARMLLARSYVFSYNVLKLPNLSLIHI